ncbi:hypothetical protein FMM05_01685 [Flavobacterium zepuense]|uniref:Lipocalin-like domain-containing protein n=1 Tax=Flavobacterium zepuense TaxID=2593302 RepID=A0A552VA71_9FLAO|nr:hypothetical protein [Flavobacterium zepuense]TRW27375.1 hypothetical protein FMM05_01685 [Flavobacterium zepuense]
MKKRMLYMMMPVLLFLSCTDDTQEKDPVVEKTDSIEGLWKLIKITSSIGKPGSEYEDGDINWTFTENAGTVNVQNHIKGPEFTGMQTGSYNYKISNITSGECTQIFTIRDKDGIGGCMSISNDTLKIHNAYAGHYNLIFVR